MTPTKAAEGIRLLGLTSRKLPLREALRLQREFSDWLWANREELIRCAEAYPALHCEGCDESGNGPDGACRGIASAGVDTEGTKR